MSFTIPARAFAAVFLLTTVAAGACRFISAETAAAAAFKLMTATVALGVVPGALLTLAWRPRAELTLLELIGFGIAFSFGIVQALTILAVTLHLAPATMLAIAAAGVIGMAVAAIRKSSGHLVITLDELIVLCPILLLGIPLYIQGSPFDVYEDQLLAAIVRHLSALDAPRLDNLFVGPGITYTYPFPGLLYFMALIARLGDVDPLFVYHKLRFFWGPAALVMLYLAARAVFGHAAVACAVALTAIVFVCTGVFAMLPAFPAWWAQLVPYSYVPDVAMTVLLPALLVMAFEYVQAESSRERRFFLAGAAALILMITVVHIREIVQFAAYLGCFVVAAVVLKRLRAHLRPAAELLAVTLLVAIAYTAWHGQVVSAAIDMVGQQRASLVAMARALPVQSLILAPAPAVLGDFIQDFDQMFAGLIPFFLFGGAIVIVLFRQRPLVWLISSSTLAYLAVMTVPLLAIPYIYLTYFEILHIPVRNLVWFVYLLAGALIYVTVLTLARADRTRISLVAAGMIGGLLALLATLTLNQSASGYFAPLIAAYALTFVYGVTGGPMAARDHRRLIAGLTAGLALVALWPQRAPVQRSDQVTIRWSTGLPDERRTALENAFSLEFGERKADAATDENTWNYRLSDVAADNVQRIVTSPDVADTHFIDRTTFEVERQPAPGDHQALGVVYATWLQYPGTILLIGTAVLIWSLGLVAPALMAASGPTAGSLGMAIGAPFYRYALPYALFIVPFAFWSARPTLSPLDLAPMPPAGRAATPRTLVGQIPCATTAAMPARFAEEQVMLPERTTCAPDYELMEWVRLHVPVEAVFAVDRWTPYPPQVFLPQQAVVFPTLVASFIHEDSLFPEYYRIFDARMRQYRVQPFFNAVESPAERAEFVQALGVTHVLVSPNHYDDLRPVLDGLRGEYELRYDNARWAVYEVTRTSN